MTNKRVLELAEINDISCKVRRKKVALARSHTKEKG